MHFVIVGALPQSLYNFRGDLIRAVVARGHRVTAMAAAASAEDIARISALGADFEPFPVERSGVNPLADVASFGVLRATFRRLAPDVVLAYTIKPVIWSGLALRSSPSLAKTRFFALVTGLGYSFVGKGAVRRGLRSLVTQLYRLALARATATIFQNADNQDVFLANAIVPAERCRIVDGSGVDADHFAAAPLAAEGTHFLLIARLLGDKGLREYAAAASLVHSQVPGTTFHLVGPPDQSPDGIPLDLVRDWHARGVLVYHGAADDVRPFIKACHVYVLPSYHEGMPRSVLEAMAMGRPILTTNVPGCRETVADGVNGWLVPKGDAAALAERMTWFIDNRGLWPAMGQASRARVIARFDVRTINARMLDIMGL